MSENDEDLNGLLEKLSLSDEEMIRRYKEGLEKYTSAVRRTRAADTNNFEGGARLFDAAQRIGDTLGLTDGDRNVIRKHELGY